MFAGKDMTGRKTSRNFKPRRITERDTTSTSNDNPRLPRKLGLPRSWDYQRNNQRLARFPKYGWNYQNQERNHQINSNNTGAET